MYLTPEQYCWFWDEGDELPMFDLLERIVEDPRTGRPAGYTAVFSGFYTNCEPFAGQLPSLLSK